MYCRLCLDDLSEENAAALFCNSVETELVKIIAKYLLLELTEHDSISTSICPDCSGHLNDFHNFCKYVDERQSTLVSEFFAVKFVDDVQRESLEEPFINNNDDSVLDIKDVLMEPVSEVFVPGRPQEEYTQNTSNADNSVNAVGNFLLSDNGDERSETSRLQENSMNPECKEVPEDTEFLQLLTKYKLENYFIKLTGLHINIKCFKFIKETDLTEIFGCDIGGRIRFRGLLDEWRALHNIDPITPAYQHPQERTANSINAAPSILPKDISDTSTSNSEYKFNINKFLNTDTGKYIWDKYSVSKRLQPLERDVLITGIVREHLEKDQPMTLTTFEDISVEIENKFMNETKEFYFEKKPKPRGQLFNKYRSMTVAFRNARYSTDRLKKPKLRFQPTEYVGKDLDSAADSDVQLREDNHMEEKDWLTTRNSPWMSVEIKWRHSYTTRRREILNSPKQKILVEWPLFKQSVGYRLIGIDFELLHPGKSNLLFIKWEAFQEKLVTTCKNLVKFPAAKNLLKNLSCNSELRIYDIFRVLQAIIKPVSRKMLEKQVWKVSIVDAWNSFAVEIDSAADIPKILSERKQFCLDRHITLQPFLVIFRHSFDNLPQFALVAEGITYIFKKFLQALDTYFKMFCVLNLEYPFENSLFWQFLQDFFYDIPTQNALPNEYAEFICLLKN